MIYPGLIGAEVDAAPASMVFTASGIAVLSGFGAKIIYEVFAKIMERMTAALGLEK